MKYLNFSKLHLILIACLLLSSLFSSCGDSELTNYKEKIIGEWELKNVGDLQASYKNKPFLLKNATMLFNKNGTLETRMLSSRDKKTWITNTGTWSVTQSQNINQLASETLTLKSDDGPFHDDVSIVFTDERTFYISLNELEYQFVKI